MPVNKTYEFVYFQSKAKHYETIKNIKPSVKDKLEEKYMKTLSFSSYEKEEKPLEKKRRRFTPLLKEIEIKYENEKMIVRLLRMYKSYRTEVKAQGNYSRFNKYYRPFRHTNPYNIERNRSIYIENNGMKYRINKMKPCVGNSSEWSRHFGRSLELKKNASRYLMEESRSRRSLHNSRLVPRYLDAVLEEGQGEKNTKGEMYYIYVTRDVVLNLPEIKVKAPQFTHSMKHHNYKRMLLIDSSRSSLNSVTNKSHYAINPEKNATIIKMYQYNQQNHPNLKFFYHESHGQKYKSINIKSVETKKEKENELKIALEAKSSTDENNKQSSY